MNRTNCLDCAAGLILATRALSRLAGIGLVLAAVALAACGPGPGGSGAPGY